MEYREKDKIPNLYQILGLSIDVCKEPNCNELIHKAYIKKAKLCHPDKHPGRKDMEELFELITSAYDILRDEKQRTEYNHKLSIWKQTANDFFDLKKGSNEYAKIGYNHKKKLPDQEFREMMKSLDAKHGFDPSKMNEPISLHDTSKKLHELTKIRSEQDMELKPEKIFDNEAFDLRKFNAAFDLIHKNDESIIPYKGVPIAWGDGSTSTDYCSFNNLDDLYDNNDEEDAHLYQKYSNTKIEPQTKIRITKEDIENLEGADYVDGHKFLDEKYYHDIKSKLRSREMDTKNFGKMKYNDFKQDDFAGYGISDKLDAKHGDNFLLDDDLHKRVLKILSLSGIKDDKD